MKLRFRKNSLRLRLNQREVAHLASGHALEERVEFPGNAALVYRLLPDSPSPFAGYENGAITIAVPAATVRAWESAEEIGLYYSLENLDIAIEKDLQCNDGPAEEKDPLAYPRKVPC
jgi:hypothetical protein